MAKKLDWDRVNSENKLRRQSDDSPKGVIGGPPTASEAARRSKPVKKRIQRRRVKLAAALAKMRELKR